VGSGSYPGKAKELPLKGEDRTRSGVFYCSLNHIIGTVDCDCGGFLSCQSDRRLLAEVVHRFPNNGLGLFSNDDEKGASGLPGRRGSDAGGGSDDLRIFEMAFAYFEDGLAGWSLKEV
jgi:hypothetical protein